MTTTFQEKAHYLEGTKEEENDKSCLWILSTDFSPTSSETAHITPTPTDCIMYLPIVYTLPLPKSGTIDSWHEINNS